MYVLQLFRCFIEGIIAVLLHFNGKRTIIKTGGVSEINEGPSTISQASGVFWSVCRHSGRTMPETSGV